MPTSNTIPLPSAEAGMEKICRICERSKPLSEITKNQKKPGGYDTICRTCNTDKVITWYHNTSREKRDQRNQKVLIYNQTPAGKYTTYKRGAKVRNLPFTITIEEFTSFWQNPCTYCGSDIQTIGLDRIDSSLGYSLDNLTPCCSVCNVMKMAMSTAKFIEHCQRVINHFGL